VTFDSAASLTKINIFAAIMTGMGKDVASGLLMLREAGALTFGQSESSCAVYGMSKEAIKIGACMLSGRPEKLSEHLKEFSQNGAKKLLKIFQQFSEVFLLQPSCIPRK
jgi:chemotaxis response regulator CheB